MTTPAAIQNLNEFHETAGLTREVAQFILDTDIKDLPFDLIDLGKKSILDGIGLALAGSVAKSRQLVAAYLKELGRPWRSLKSWARMVVRP